MTDKKAHTKEPHSPQQPSQSNHIQAIKYSDLTDTKTPAARAEAALHAARARWPGFVGELLLYYSGGFEPTPSTTAKPVLFH